MRRALAAAQTAAELKAALEDATTVRASSPLPRASFLVHFSHPPRRLQAAVLEESELTPHRTRLGEMVIGALERAANALSLKAALDGAAGATGKEVEAALSKARSRLAELRNSEKWKAEREKVGVDHLMPKERPDEHLCAISKEPMVDPVVAEDGFTYERSQIEAWLKNSRTSPKTREEMGTDLRPNKDLGRLIRDWEEQEHKKCMAMAAAQAQPPPLALQDTPTLRAELQKREEAKAAAASGSAATEVAPTPARQSTETLKAETAALEAEVARKQGELRRREAAKDAAANLERQPSSSES